ncbi:hypothetical protein PRZ48_007389 [Zasmidium cellare]|uniref:Uncharacterized protein n=1 Tax=Zasmidium cellare TaxID=395010 RepID=A0ABR0EJZ9_ZASCE|nr:hypothetical protein PRZ48_007389 [Zasmidium cellare]
MAFILEDVRYPLEDSLEAAVAERRKSKDLLNFYRSFAFTSSVNGSSLHKIPATSGSMEQLFRYFAFVSRQIRDDVCHFIAQSMRELSAVDLKGRGRPSEFKVKFLLHLRECHTELSKECTTDLKILNIIIEAIQLPADWYDRGLYDVQVDLESDARDLEYLAKELLSTTKYIDEVKDRIKELMELSEKRRTVVVTFLVALFVPMAVGGTLGFLQMIGYVLNIPLAIIGLLFTLIHLWTAFRLKRIAMFITWVVMGVVIGLMTMLYTQSIVGLSLIWAFGWVFLVAVWVFKPDFMYSPARYKKELEKRREGDKQLGNEIDT